MGPGTADPRQRSLRVFLSHTSELRSSPADRSIVQAAEEAVSATGNVICDMAYLPARDLPPADVCREAVGRADVYVLIAGHRYGSLAPDEERVVSYTELEFDAATEARMTRLVFVLDDEAVGPASMFVDHDHAARQREFREKVRRARVMRT